MSDNSFDAAQKALRNRAVVDLEEPLPDEQPTRWWLRIVVLLVFFVFGAIVWLSWQDNAGDGEPVLVQAPPEPIKGPPDDPGGMDVPNDGSEIATVLSGEQDEPPPLVGPAPIDEPPARPQAQPPAATEEVIPPAQETAGAAGADATGPMTSMDEIMPSDEMEEAEVPVPAAGQTAPAASAPTDAAGISATPLPPLIEVPNLPSSTPATPAPMPTPPATMPEPATPMPVVPPVVDTTPVVPPQPEPPAAAAPAPTPPALVETVPDAVVPPAPPSPPQPPSGGPRIQVGSLRDEAAANTAWERVARKNPGVFEGRRRVITSAEVKGATYYRAQLEGFASRAEAQEACATIKRNGNDCLVVAR